MPEHESQTPCRTCHYYYSNDHYCAVRGRNVTTGLESEGECPDWQPKHPNRYDSIGGPIPQIDPALLTIRTRSCCFGCAYALPLKDSPQRTYTHFAAGHYPVTCDHRETARHAGGARINYLNSCARRSEQFDPACSNQLHEQQPPGSQPSPQVPF
jgi:hypothetical protein